MEAGPSVFARGVEQAQGGPPSDRDLIVDHGEVAEAGSEGVGEQLADAQLCSELVERSLARLSVVFERVADGAARELWHSFGGATRRISASYRRSLGPLGVWQR